MFGGFFMRYPDLHQICQGLHLLILFGSDIVYTHGYIVFENSGTRTQ